MIRALYTATSGMMVESRRVDLISKNLYDAQIPGYKATRIIKAARPETDRRVPTDVQTLQVGQFPNPAAGALRTTNKSLDFALEGDGFFAVQTRTGTAYTRDGRFHRSVDGVVRDGTANALLGESGPIELPEDTGMNPDIRLEPDGTLRVDGRVIDKLLLQDFPDFRGLQAAGGRLFYPTGAVQPQASTARVIQNTVEDSNVQVVEEMTRMIESLRAFESYQKLVNTVMDDVTGEAVRRLGRVA